MATSPSNSMYLDVLKYKDVFALDKLNDIKCFREYKKSPDASLDVNQVIKYVVLLYSKDSVLNRKPMGQLSERRVKAANLSGLNPDDQSVKSLLFDLLSERIRELILDYLIYQNQMIWTERCIVEAQIQENQRIRLKPIQNKTAPVKKKRKTKKEDEEYEEPEPPTEEDDKYIIESSNKKYSLTDHFDKYWELLKKYDNEIFADHENVQEAMSRRERKSIETMVDE